MPIKSILSKLNFGIILLTCSTLYANTLIDTVLSQYGFSSFQKAEKIQFTFSAKVAGLGPKHKWIWWPKKDSVTSVDEKFSYSRKAMGEKERAIDKKFINDQYWLIFPLHLGMDKDTQIEIDSSLSSSPKNKEMLRKIRVIYRTSGGYTPKDTYELFVQPDGIIREWTYFRNSGKIGASFTWENNQRYGGILFSLKHQGLVNIDFSGIIVE